MSTLRALSLGALLAAASSGCTIRFVPSGGFGVGGAGPERFAGVSGGECDDYDRGASARKHEVLDRVCHTRRMVTSDAVHSAMAIEKRHHAFDDRRPDQLAAALNVVDGAACEHQPLALGMSTYYAEVLDEKALPAALDALGLASDTKSAFVDLVHGSREKLLALAGKLDPRRRHLYVDVPHAVIAKRAAYVKEHADLYGKLDALEARAEKARASKQAPVDLVHAFGELRGAYFEACTSDDCRFDPFPIEVTRELALLHVSAGDTLTAHAESFLLREPAAGRHLFSVETGTAVYAAMTEERHAYDQMVRAREQGVDEATLAARFGSPPPIQIDPDNAYVGSETLPDVATALGGEDRPTYKTGGGIVRSVADANKKNARGEALALVAFKEHVTKEDVTSCFETGHVTGVSFDSSNHAHLEYESVCNVVGSKTNVEKIPPLMVPKIEVAQVQAGENLLVFLRDDGADGVVVRATAKTEAQRGDKRKTPIVQVRGERLGKKGK